MNKLITPVLFVTFNRFDTAEKVFEAIRAAKPTKLYFANDGPRNKEESAKCERVRALAKRVDWPCELQTRFNEKNMGLKYGVSSAITWFFDHEPEGIILEDDTLPAPSFFIYCQLLLKHYRDNERIWMVMGTNLMTEWDNGSKESYYFSAHGYGAPWGWAGWRRAWNMYDVEMSKWPSVRDGEKFDDFYLSKMEKEEAYRLFEGTHSGAILTWDFQHDFCRMYHDGLQIIPNENLIVNIGFDGDGTNTVVSTDVRNKTVVGQVEFPLRHPASISVDVERDLAYFKAYIQTSRFRKFKEAVKAMIPDKIDQAITPILSKIQRKLGIS